MLPGFDPSFAPLLQPCLSLFQEGFESFNVFKCNYDLKSLKLQLPLQFYKDALSIWQTINQHTPENKEQVLNEILWNNRFIKINGFSVYYKNWHNAGVIRIKDIFFFF